MTHTLPIPPNSCSDTLEDLRAAVAGRGAKNALDRTIQAAFLKLIEVLLRLLADFQAGKLAPVAPETRDAAGGGGASAGSVSSAGRGAGQEPATVAPAARRQHRDAAETAVGATHAHCDAAATEKVGDPINQRGPAPSVPGHDWSPAVAGMTGVTGTFAGMPRRTGDVRHLGPGFGANFASCAAFVSITF